MILAAVTLFAASALLFLVQPMTARHVLPLLGGTPAAWTTCMLFFQCTLLGGYVYAHKAPRPLVHMALVALGIVPLCIVVPPFWNAFVGDAAVVGLLLLLAATIGLPFFVLATTAPLVQRWQAARSGAKDPYVLFAASNAGGLLGLLAYPVLVEPSLGLGEQRVLLAVGYGVVAVAIAAHVLLLRRRGAPVAPVVAQSPIANGQRARWLLLAFVPSSLLLGVTAHVTTNLAPIPLLWAIPLALYLITFVIAFSYRPSPRAENARGVLPRWLPSFLRWTESPRPVTAILPAALLPLVVWFWSGESGHGLSLIVLHLLALFLVSLALHGRLAAERPAPDRLTEFYLWLAAGGALGGVFNALIAPFAFPAAIEYPLLLALACFLLPGPVRSTSDFVWGAAVGACAAALLVTLPAVEGRRLLVLGLPALATLWMGERPRRLGVAVAGLLLVGGAFDDRGTTVIHRDRSVFGAHRVERAPTGALRLVHGNILHGAQHAHADRRREPLTYFHREGPCGEIFAALANKIPGGRVGAVGLGAGSIAAYGARGERWTFFEVDAAIEATARTQFTFLADSAAEIDVRIGDGRLLLAEAEDGEFGLLVLDAFNSAAVPVHLLTREALATYVEKLAPGGVLAFHVSSLYVDLAPVLGDLAADAGLVAHGKEEAELSAAARAEPKSASEWVVMARRSEDLAGLSWPALAARGRQPWTDDRSSVLRELKLFR